MKKLLPQNFLKRNFLFICLFIFSVQSAFATTLYVNAASTATTPDGLKWSTAYPTLEQALAVAYFYDDIWVAKGTYQPAPGSSFHMVDGVQIYGGFFGNENSLDQRSIRNNVTILKGNGNSVVSNVFTEEVPMYGRSLLDGFTIQDGSTPSSLYGGGIFNKYASPILRNLIIKNNTSTNYGGGIALQFSTSIIENVLIENNTAAYLGGGISIESNSSPTLKNVVISNNESQFGAGGGMDVYESYFTATGVVFDSNKASLGGGGVNIESATSWLYLNNLVFSNNIASDGAGFSGVAANVVFNNVTFSKNIASGSGGAIKYDNGGSGKQSSITNGVFWGNVALSEADVSANSFSINYSYTQTNFTSGAMGNITGSASPFTNQNLVKGADGIWLTNDDGLQLTAGAPARNSGTNNTVNSLPQDVTGAKRIYDTTVDMGAYEAQPDNNAKLTALSTNSVTLSPIFDPILSKYTVRLDAATTGTTVTAIFGNNATAKIKGTDNTLTTLMSGTASGTQNLAQGLNTIEVQVTAQDGVTVKTYTLTVVRGKAPQTITLATIGTKRYNDLVYPVVTGGESGNPITYTSSDPAIAIIEADPQGIDRISFKGIGTVTITANQTGNSEYDAASPVSETIVVNKAIPGATRFNAQPDRAINEAWSFYVGTARAYTGSNRVYFTSSNPAVVSIRDNIYYELRGVGTAIITAHLDGDANYEAAAPVSQNQVVFAAAQTITFNTLTAKTYGDAPFNLTATGGSSGNPITYVSSNPAVATIDGNTVTILAQGTTNITASQAANSNYNAATDVVQVLNVNQATLTYTATPVAVPFGFAIPALTGIVTGMVNNEDLATAATGTATFTTTAVNGSLPGSYAITGSGLTATDNYKLVHAAANSTALTINDNYPIVTTTSPATAITPTTATLSGNATSDGGYPITEKGIVYGTTLNPILGIDTKITNGDGTGTIGVNVTSLIPGTVYHFRSYAINSTGTSYGADVAFTTPFEVPSIQASEIVSTGTATTTKTISWTNGNGARRVVLISNTVTGYPLVTNGSNYTANVSFSSSSSASIAGSTGGSWKCVYNGTGTTVAVTNFVSNNDYRVMVLEYNGTGTAIVYNTVTTATNNPVIFSTPLGTPTVPALSGVSATAFSADWLAISNASSYAYDVSTSSDFSTVLAGYTDLVTTTNRVAVSGLLPSTTYYLRTRSVNSFDLESTNSPMLSFTTLAQPNFVATYDFISATAFNTSKNDPTPVPVPLPAGLTFETAKYVGSAGSTATSSTAQFAHANWGTTTLNTATYYEFTLTPAATHNLSVNSISFAVTRNSSGPNKYLVRSSIDDFSANLAGSSSGSNPTVSGGLFTMTGTTKLNGSTINPGSGLVNLTAPVTFRIYAYGGSSSSTGTFAIDDVKFTGTLTGPPTNTANHPKTGTITPSSITLINSLDKAGTTYYVIAPATSAAPSVAQVLAGQDADGVAAKSGSFGITSASTPFSTLISGLTATTDYKIYVVSTDAASPAVAQSTVTTLTATTADKIIATLTLSNLTATYDGIAKSATVITDPIGLSGVTVTYAGSTTAPTAVGTYAVVASLTNGDYSATPVTGSLVISKATTTLTLANLTATYDGTAKAATVSTNPAGLSGVTITYAGSTTAPTAVGTYAVIASLNNANYEANNATGTLEITKATTTLTLANLTATYDGTAKAATVSTNPAGLSGVTITYAGSTTAPTAVGTYAVVASLNNANYEANNATGTLEITKAAATLTLANLTATYDGTAKAATVTTNPSGLSGVTITYAGSTTAPTAVGTYAVVASLNNTNYEATNATGTLEITKAAATLTLANLTATYDGNAKAATVTTNPAGLSGVTITYAGSITAPTAVGSYAIVASLNNATYEATNATGTLIINKADQVITFATFAGKSTNSLDFEPGASVNTGLAITYTSSNPSVATVYQDGTDGNKWKIHIVNDGITNITATQAGNANYNPQSLTRTLAVAPITLPVTLTNYSAKMEGNRSRLEWSTSSEQNNDRFEIERSVDGTNFSYMATVKGNGTTSSQHVYSAYDVTPFNGTNYYRLKQYDFDGKVKTLGEKALTFSLNVSVSVRAFPNPTTDKVNLSFKNYNGNEAKIVITDLMGRTIHTENIRLIAGTDSYSLRLISKLIPGQYIINVGGIGLNTAIKLIAY